jgi:hypothetical protein
MRTLNSEIFMPNENPNYNKDVSLIVIYPGGNMSQFKSDLTALKPWFSKYVVAIPDEPNINWMTLKDQIDIKVGESDYNITDVTIGVYEDSVDILDDLESIKPRNLLLFNPTPTSNLLESVKKVTGSQSTSANLYYSYKSDKTNVKIIDSLKSLSKNILIGNASITDLYSKWGADIETHLTKLKLKTLEDDVVEFTNKYESKDSKNKIKLLIEDAREGDNKGNPLDIDVVQVFYAGDQLKLKVFLDDTDRRRDEWDQILKSEIEDEYLFNSQDEYYEQTYAGDEEVYKPLPESLGVIDDVSTNYVAPVGSVPMDYSISKGLPPGSKLLIDTIKYGKFIGDAREGLAGHRLRPFMRDLSKYLKSKGFGTVGDLGVTRDLKASTYPSNPARAAGSFHGAGLAIDTTWSISGIKWSSIYDNKNLVQNKELVIAVWEFVKSQKDILWGAQWGGSDPSKGVVLGHGITEFHHFQIAYKEVHKYWEPFKNDLSQLGFDYKKLKDTPDFLKLYKVLLS